MINTPLHNRKSVRLVLVVHFPVVGWIVVDLHKGFSRTAWIRTGTHFHLRAGGTGTVKRTTPVPAGMLVRRLWFPGTVAYLYIITRAEGLLYKRRHTHDFNKQIKMDIFSYIQMDGENGIIAAAPDASKQDGDVQVTSSTDPNPPQHFDIKILAEIRPEDAHFLKQTRGATLVPTYAVKDKNDRVIGLPLSIKAQTTKEFVAALASGEVAASFPKGSFNKAIEVIY